MSAVVCSRCRSLFAPAWGRDTCARCAGRATTGKPKPVDWKAVDELVARARKLKPIGPGMNTGSAVAVRAKPKRVDLDRWGKSQGGGVRWVGVNCLRASVANLLGATNIEEVPDPEPHFDSEDWLSGYNAELAKLGARLERQPAHVCMDIRNRGRWIAAIHEPNDEADHVLVARGSLVYHDPAQCYSAIPVDRLMYGFVLRPTHRVVPVVSLHGSGRALVAR